MKSTIVFTIVWLSVAYLTYPRETEKDRMFRIYIQCTNECDRTIYDPCWNSVVTDKCVKDFLSCQINCNKLDPYKKIK